jgi:hypothetical protein
MNSTVKRILNIVGIASAVAVGILVPIMASLPAGSTWLVRAGIAVAILSTLQRALGTAPTDGAKPADELAQTKVTPIRPVDKQSGVVSLGLLVALTVFLFATIGIVYASHADTPISKCWSSICIGPQVAASTFTLRFDTKALVAQIPTGLACYGFNLPSGYLSGGWCVTGQLGTKATTQFIGTGLLFTIMRAVVVGPVYHYGDDGNWFGVALGGSLTSAFNLEAPAKAAP